MKRMLIVLLILLATVGVVSASDGHIGVSVAPEWFWYSTETKTDLGRTNLAFMAEGAHYFGKKGSGVGIEYGLGAFFPLNYWVGDADPVKLENASSSFIFKAGAGYRHEFSDLFGISAGLGIRGKYGKMIDYNLGDIIKSNTTEFVLDLYGDISFDISLTDFLRINAGIMLGGPVLTQATTKMDIGGVSGSNTESSDISGFWLAPVIAVSYTY